MNDQFFNDKLRRRRRFGNWKLGLDWELDIGIWDLRHEVTVPAAAHDPWRLFIKNTGPCELERGGIGADAWPVSVR